MDNFLGWTDEQIEDLINRVYGGVVSSKALPMDLYESILERFDESIMDGFGGVGDTVAKSNLFVKFTDNIKQFSFAKTFQQVNDMGNFIFDKAGNQIAFSEFKKSASQIFEVYNNNWLETEFNTAKSITESARQWVEIQEDKDVLPLLKYSTVGDGRVRSSHKSLDGIIRPVDDPFWRQHYPPNDFNCRCIVEQIEEGKVTDLKGEAVEKINPLFENNPAVTGQVFSKAKHPYFNGLGSLLKAPIKDILPKPKPIPKLNKKYSFKNNKEAKAAIIRDIEKSSVLKINKITVSSRLGIDEMARRADSVKSLFGEYKLSEAVVNHRGTDIVFRSTKKYYGVVSSGRKVSTNERYIARINFGDQSNMGKGRYRLDSKTDKIDGFRSSSAVDAENLDLATNVHEFAHVIATERVVAFGAKNDVSFFNSLKEIRLAYRKEMLDLNVKHDRKQARAKIYKIHLGNYANTNLNEFMAEGFTEYKLHSNPSKYAEKIGKLIDKHYKK